VFGQKRIETVQQWKSFVERNLRPRIKAGLGAGDAAAQIGLPCIRARRPVHYGVAALLHDLERLLQRHNERPRVGSARQPAEHLANGAVHRAFQRYRAAAAAVILAGARRRRRRVLRSQNRIGRNVLDSAANPADVDAIRLLGRRGFETLDRVFDELLDAFEERLAHLEVHRAQRQRKQAQEIVGNQLALDFLKSKEEIEMAEQIAGRRPRSRPGPLAHHVHFQLQTLTDQTSGQRFWRRRAVEFEYRFADNISRGKIVLASKARQRVGNGLPLIAQGVKDLFNHFIQHIATPESLEADSKSLGPLAIP